MFLFHLFSFFKAHDILRDPTIGPTSINLVIVKILVLVAAQVIDFKCTLTLLVLLHGLLLLGPVYMRETTSPARPGAEK